MSQFLSQRKTVPLLGNTVGLRHGVGQKGRIGTTLVGNYGQRHCFRRRKQRSGSRECVLTRTDFRRCHPGVVGTFVFASGSLCAEICCSIPYLLICSGGLDEFGPRFEVHMEMILMRSWLILSVCCALAGCVDSPEKQKDAPIPTAPALEATRTSGSGPGPDDPDAPTEFTELPSGLKYKLLRKTERTKPHVSDTVKCHYRGWLDDGTEFDSSYKRGSPTEFPLNGVIKGWTEGLQYCPIGGKIELEIPSDLGYGDRGSPPTIPPGATLHFIVELVEIL